MKSPYQILLICESAIEAGIVEQSLESQGGVFALTHVGGKYDLGTVINWPWDVILLDGEHSSVTAQSVLEKVSSSTSPPPVIIVSEVDSATYAAGLLRTGVADFVLRNDIASLWSVLETAIRNNKEQALQLENNRFSQLASVSLDATSETVLWLDPLGRFIYANKAARTRIGHDLSDMLLTSVAEVVPELKGRRWRALWRLLRKKEGLLLQFNVVQSDGRSVPVEASLSLMQYQGDMCMCVFARDISERKSIEIALEREERRYKDLFHNSPVSMWEEDLSGVRLFFDELRSKGVSDIKGYFDANPGAVVECIGRVSILDVNQATLDLLEASSKEQLLGGKIVKVLTEDSFKEVQRYLCLLAEGHYAFSSELDHRTMTGRIIRVGMHFNVAPNYRASLGRVVVSLLDVTDRKCMQQELEDANDRLELRVAERTRELGEMNRNLLHEVAERRNAEERVRLSEQRHRNIVDTLPVLIHAHGIDGTVVYWNKQCEIVLGYAEEDIIGQHDFREKLYPDPDYRALVDRLHQQRPFKDRELEMVTASGEVRIIQWSTSDHTSPVPGWVNWEIGIDVTEAKAAALRIQNLTHDLLRLQENERQRLSLELHDNVAQYLSSLKIMSETLFDGEGKVNLTVLLRAQQLSHRLQECIASVREMAYRLRPSSLDQLGLVQTLEQFCRELSSECGMEIELSIAGMEKLRPDFDTEINLYRLVQEALRNAVKHSCAERVEVKLVASSPHLLLRIDDNGCGFDVETRRWKASVERRMGLQSMEERVRLLDGEFSLTSVPGKGTKVFAKVPYREKDSE